MNSSGPQWASPAFIPEASILPFHAIAGWASPPAPPRAHYSGNRGRANRGRREARGAAHLDWQGRDSARTHATSVPGSLLANHDAESEEGRGAWRVSDRGAEIGALTPAISRARCS